MNEVIQRMQSDESLYVSSHADGLQRVLGSKYVLIGNSRTVRKAMEDLDQEQQCNITEIQMDGIEQMVALIMPASNAYRKMINYEILRYYSNGLNNRISEAIARRRSKCVKQKQFHRISTGSTTFQLYLFLMGSALAIVFIGIELMCYHFKKRTNM
ncbi:uncharacterized protein LOC125760767 [Anopheles funestus]|uniref:uncharacterized protein LOC125760767 n=1 Tax=Anopheles funestus TaxID=62324 RepID=UPI0020C5CED9|nr:uncharacterized protein LOC125760767 [Anopheles funestus]